MYRVMIIDDESAVRKLLQISVAWDELGLQVVGEASSGIEAINVIDELDPDIAFVDISMPFMNGIEFIKLATARYPDLQVIVLTGFDDFEYARQCVSLPVFEYMLKPIVRRDVRAVLEKVVEKLDARGPKKEKPQEATPEYGSLDQIVKYLEENFRDSSINLTSVAQQFGFNTSYLSRKFKQVTGLSFVEYLMKCRMDKATALAGRERKMFEIANEVGIPDPNYFSRCFKKYTGMSYSEYVEKKN